MNRGRLFLGAAMLGVAAAAAPTPAAQADQTCVNPWLVRQDGSRQHLAGPSGVCRETGWTWRFTVGTEPTTVLAPGPYKGAGVELRFTFPV